MDGELGIGSGINIMHRMDKQGATVAQGTVVYSL